jgi:hypothetical protein
VAAAAGALDAAAIDKLKVAELRAELVTRGLDKKGKKAELAARLKAAAAGQQTLGLGGAAGADVRVVEQKKPKVEVIDLC